MKLFGVGEAFKLIELSDEELTPSFGKIIESDLEGRIYGPIVSSEYVIRHTCFTSSLVRFLSQVSNALGERGVTPLPLVKGFGYGKTHAIILLWYLYTSMDETMVEGRIRKVLGEANYSNEVASNTIVLACDVSNLKRSPLSTFFRVLRAQIDPEGLGRLKSHELRSVLEETLPSRSEEERYVTKMSEFLELIVEIGKELNKLGKRFRLLVLVDELGFGTLKRLRRYFEKGEESYVEEINNLIDLLLELPSELSSSLKDFSLIIVYAIANQDLRDLEAEFKFRLGKGEEDRASIAEGFLNKLKGLEDRILRYTGGHIVTAYSLSPEENLQIATYRILDPMEGVEDRKLSSINEISTLLSQLNLFEKPGEREGIISKIDNAYPLSPDLVDLLLKSQNDREIPRTGYLRTAITLLREAARRCLIEEPESPLIGVRHLDLKRASLIDFMGDFSMDWFHVVEDLDHGVKTIEERNEELAYLAGHIAKILLSKGITGNIGLLLELSENSARYGTTLDEIQLSVIATAPPKNRANELELIPEALEELGSSSRRIRRAEISGEEFLFPAIIIRSVYAKLDEYLKAENEDMSSRMVSYVCCDRDTIIKDLLNKARAGTKGYAVELVDLEDLLNATELNREIGNYFEEGYPIIAMVPPWSLSLDKKVREVGYLNLLNQISEELNRMSLEGKIARPSFLIVLIPNMIELRAFAENLAAYRAHMRFLSYLKEKGKIVEEQFKNLQERAREKRLESYLKDRKTAIKSALLKEVEDAGRFASRKLVEYSRKIVASLLSLYETPIFYQISAEGIGKFIVPLEYRISGDQIDQKLKRVEERELLQYSDMVGNFFRLVLDQVGFERNKKTIANAVLRKLKETFEEGVMYKELIFTDFVESLLSGAIYGIRPICYDLAEESVLSLEKKVISLLDREIIIHVNKASNRILFEERLLEPEFNLKVSGPRAVNPKAEFSIRIIVYNKGSAGSCTLRLREESGAILREWKDVFLEQDQKFEEEFSLTSPETIGKYSLVAELLVKREVISSEKIEINITEAPPPPPKRRISFSLSDVAKAQRASNLIGEILKSIDEISLALETERLMAEFTIKDVQSKQDFLVCANALLAISSRFKEPKIGEANVLVQIRLKPKTSLDEGFVKEMLPDAEMS